MPIQHRPQHPHADRLRLDDARRERSAQLKAGGKPAEAGVYVATGFSRSCRRLFIQHRLQRPRADRLRLDDARRERSAQLKAGGKPAEAGVYVAIGFSRSCRRLFIEHRLQRPRADLLRLDDARRERSARRIVGLTGGLGCRSRPTD